MPSTTKTALALGVLVAGLSFTADKAQAAQKKAYFAGGCFWCVEKDFESLSGVGDVVSGFTGGTIENPTYKQVTSGGSGHYEATVINYDSSKITYDQLLYNFFRSIDPTDAGGQFCDRGDSYRTAIFVTSDAERAAAEKAKAQAEKDLGQKIVTPILTASTFYPASSYHQNYYKSTDIVLTRRGPKSKAAAYKFYRNACGRDQRVQALWGSVAPFAAGH